MKRLVVIAASIALVGVVAAGVAVAGNGKGGGKADKQRPVATALAEWRDCMTANGVTFQKGARPDAAKVRAALEKCGRPFKARLGRFGKCEDRDAGAAAPGAKPTSFFRVGAAWRCVDRDELKKRAEKLREHADKLRERMKAFNECLRGQGLTIPAPGTGQGARPMPPFRFDRAQLDKLRQAFGACKGELRPPATPPSTN